jgi:Flp pilus assembly CpaE family ATPase
VADMGSQFSFHLGPLLQATATILMVAEANVPSLWTLERRLKALKGLGIDQDRARIVINRWHKSDEEILQTIQKDLNRSVYLCLPNDYRKVSAAINQGVPLVDHRNDVLNSRYRQLLANLIGVEVSPTSRKAFGGLFSFSGKVA